MSNKSTNTSNQIYNNSCQNWKYIASCIMYIEILIAYLFLLLGYNLRQNWRDLIRTYTNFSLVNKLVSYRKNVFNPHLRRALNPFYPPLPGTCVWKKPHLPFAQWWKWKVNYPPKNIFKENQTLKMCLFVNNSYQKAISYGIYKARYQYELRQLIRLSFFQKF